MEAIFEKIAEALIAGRQQEALDKGAEAKQILGPSKFYQGTISPIRNNSNYLRLVCVRSNRLPREL